MLWVLQVWYYYTIIVNSTYRWSVFRFCAHWWRRYLVPGGQLVDVHHVSRLRVHHEIPGTVKRFFALDAHQRQAAIVQVSGPFCMTRNTNISTGNTWNSVYLRTSSIVKYYNVKQIVKGVVILYVVIEMGWM